MNFIMPFKHIMRLLSVQFRFFSNLSTTAVVCYCQLVCFLKSPLSRFRQSDPQQQRRAQTRARQKQTQSGQNVRESAKEENEQHTQRGRERKRGRVPAFGYVCSKWVAAGQRGKFAATRLDYQTHTHTHIQRNAVAIMYNVRRTHKATKINEQVYKKMCVNRIDIQLIAIKETRSTSSSEKTEEIHLCLTKTFNFNTYAYTHVHIYTHI